MWSRAESGAEIKEEIRLGAKELKQRGTAETNEGGGVKETGEESNRHRK